MRHFFSLFLFLALGLQAQITHPADGFLYDRTTVSKIEITLPADSLAALLNPANAFAEHDYPANMVFTRGTTVDTVLNIGFRLRGNTSRTADKKSFKVSINSFVSGRRYQGVKDMNLNGEHNDPSISRARLCWELGAEIGLPVSRVAHTQLYINGVYRGLYINVEHINDDWLGLRFGNSSGNLYKCTWPANLRYISQNPNDYKLLRSDSTRVYELKTNESVDDYAGLENLIDILNNTPTNQLECALDDVFNIEGFLKVLAFEVAMGHWDNYFFNQNNYYLYDNPATGKFEYLPYDIDNSMGVDWFNIDWATRNINNWGNPNEFMPLADRLLALPQLNEMFKFYLKEINLAYGNISFENKVNGVHTQIAPYAYQDTFKGLDYGFTNLDFKNSFDSTQAQFHVKKGILTYRNQRYVANTQQLGIVNSAPIISFIQAEQTSGNQFLITALVEDETAVTAVCTYKLNNGTPQSIPLFDDGQHGDGAAGDGFFGNYINNLNTGTLSYQITATDSSNKNRTRPCTPKNVAIATANTLVINEFMADNDNVIADPFGNFSDWVELFNNSADSIFLGDYYLTDDASDPFEWQLPAEYLAAGGFKLIWADSDTTLGADHADFSLSKGGEEIGLFKNNGGVADTIDYILFGAQTTDVSYGRQTDASAVWVFFNTSTPNASNGTIGILEEDALGIRLFPNPYQGAFQAQNTTGNVMYIEVFSSHGMLLQRVEIEPFSEKQIFDGCAPGLRIVRISDGKTSSITKLISF
jgi:spore coat protein CotH